MNNIDKNKIYTVKNRSVGMVVYNIREDNIRREFAPGETKRINFGELEKLSFQPGGRELMTNYLQIREEEATTDLGIKRELEYDMSEQDVIKLIQTGSQDEFLDCLDFAPEGIIDLIKHLAVQLPMTDTMKCKAVKEKTGFDVMAALNHLEQERMDEASADAPAASTGERRVKPAAPAAPVQGERRVKTPEYKVTSKTTVEEKEEQ